MAVNYERIGKRIQQLRKLKKMSQADLAEHMKVQMRWLGAQPLLSWHEH